MPFMPENVASFGGDIDALALVITIIVGVAFLIAEGVLVVSVLRFRRRPGRPARHITGSTWRQARWVVIPVLLVVVADVFIDLRTSGAWERIKQAMPEPELAVRITGQQFAWVITYPGRDGVLGTGDDVQLVNELHVPVDRTVLFALEARDVLHSFWVPSLRLKQDAVPGRTIQGWFKAIRPGQYDIACAELCGVAHGVMKATLRVHSSEDWARWSREAGAAPAREIAQR
jgi:cytochrome c oxidase subunit 2